MQASELDGKHSDYVVIRVPSGKRWHSLSGGCYSLI